MLQHFSTNNGKSSNTTAQHVLTDYCPDTVDPSLILTATMTSAAAAPRCESNKSKVRRNLGLLFGCGIRSKKDGDAGLARSSATNPKPTVETDGIHKQPEENKAVNPPSPTNTEDTEDSSVDDIPNMDDPATTSRATATGNAGSGTTFSFGGSSMERRIAQVIFSFLLTFLTLGMAGRSDSKKAIAADDGKAPDAGTESKKKQDEEPKQVTWSTHAEAFSQ